MILSIDTGGTKTLVAEISGEAIVREKKFPTPQNVNEYIATLAEVLKDFKDFYDKVVVAVPADVQNGMVITAANLPWNNFNLVEELRKAVEWMRNVQVFLVNDAKLAALGVSTGKGRDMYVTLSTGIGAGMTVDGQLIKGLDSMEVGHIVIDGVEWEKVASGKAFLEKYKKFGEEFAVGDTIWNEYAEEVAKGLLVLIPLLRPDKIFFGGSMGQHFAKYGELVNDILDKQLSSQFRRPELKQANDPERVVALSAIKYEG